MSHPMTQQNYQQTFGSASRGLESVSISTADFDGIDPTYIDEYTLAFDEMGAPHAFCYDLNSKNDLKTGTIVLTSGSFTTTITVSPYTGEIQVQ
jgi:hypothetical protein